MLMQSLYQAYNEFGAQPNELRSGYHHEEAAARPAYDVQILFESTNLTNAGFEFTNIRMVKVLSLLGFDYSLQKDLTYLMEYDFTVVIEPDIGTEQIIASGCLINRKHGNSSVQAAR